RAVHADRPLPRQAFPYTALFRSTECFGVILTDTLAIAIAKGEVGLACGVALLSCLPVQLHSLLLVLGHTLSVQVAEPESIQCVRSYFRRAVVQSRRGLGCRRLLA